MTDSSSLVPWVTVLLGCAASYLVARLTPRAISFLTALLAGTKAFAVSFGSIFVASLLHGMCIDVLHRCSTHGDGNIAYVMGGVMAFPLFWIIILWFGRVREVEPVPSISARCDAACSAAVIQHVEGKPDGSLCPVCKQVIATKRSEAKDAKPYVATRCGCGKCDQRFQLRAS